MPPTVHELTIIDCQAIRDSLELSLPSRWKFDIARSSRLEHGRLRIVSDGDGFTPYEVGLAIGNGCGLRIIDPKIHGGLRHMQLGDDGSLTWPVLILAPAIISRLDWS